MNLSTILTSPTSNNTLEPVTLNVPCTIKSFPFVLIACFNDAEYEFNPLNAKLVEAVKALTEPEYSNPYSLTCIEELTTCS